MVCAHVLLRLTPAEQARAEFALKFEGGYETSSLAGFASGPQPKLNYDGCFVSSSYCNLWDGDGDGFVAKGELYRAWPNLLDHIEGLEPGCVLDKLMALLGAGVPGQAGGVKPEGFECPSGIPAGRIVVFPGGKSITLQITDEEWVDVLASQRSFAQLPCERFFLAFRSL